MIQKARENQRMKLQMANATGSRQNVAAANSAKLVSFDRTTPTPIPESQLLLAGKTSSSEG